MSLAEWSLFIGALLVTMVLLAGTLLGRLPLSAAMVYLALGWALGPAMARPSGWTNSSVLRPLSILVALPGEGLTLLQQAMIGWFGIRGIGSVFYLVFALRHGIEPRIAATLVSLTWTVAASIVAHGITAQPLMRRYLGWSRDANQAR